MKKTVKNKQFRFVTTSILVCILSFFLSCDLETPANPEWTNPLDADNPETQGDPYRLSAEIADGGVRLIWQVVNVSGITGYSIYRSHNDSAFTKLIECALQSVSYTDTTIRNGHRYEYYVVAYGATVEADTSNIASVAVNTNPVIFIEGENTTHTPTRNVNLTILAFGAERMILSNSANFDSSEWETYTTTKNWQLSTGEGTKTVYMKVAYADGDTSSVISDAIDPAPLTPSLFIEGDSTFTPTRHVTLTIASTGATQMQLSNQPFQGDEEWLDYANSIDWELTTGSGTKTVYVNVRNDFLIEAEASDQIEPPTINSSLRFNTDSTYINHCGIALALATTSALQMKLSDTPDSSSVNWQDFTDQVDWNLPAGDGWKHVYAWFRNNFYTSTMVSDSIGLDTRVTISSFIWSSTGGDTLVPDDRVNFSLHIDSDAFGAETGGNAEVTVEGWDGIDLAGQADGSYTGSYTITNETPEVSNVHVCVSFTDRAGNAVLEESNETLTAWWTPAPGTERTFPLGNSGESIVMCWIPSGSFMMGRQNGEQGSNSDEDPRHQVTFAEGFWIGKCEVTQGQWEAVMGNNPAHGYGVGDDHPVYYVSWNDIQEFETALDDAFRLPSEAEWEYACRAGTQTRFYWGDDPNYSDIGNYAVYSENDPSGSANVGTKRPNAWGLYDMSGNVSEWCEDWYHNDYTNAPANGDAWVSPSGSYRVLRGGAWYHFSRNCRSAFRINYTSNNRNYFDGLRLVRDAD